MTPEQVNALVDRLIATLELNFGTVSKGLEADKDGNLPEIYIDVDGVDLCLTVSPL